MIDLCRQNIRNDIPLMTFETTAPALIFGDLIISVPVSIEYSVAERDGRQEVRNVSMTVSGWGLYPWEDLDWAHRADWQRAMIELWNQKHNLILRKVGA